MPGNIVANAPCWKCGKKYDLVVRRWSSRTDKATLTFVHRKGKECVVRRVPGDVSDRAMVGLPRK